MRLCRGPCARLLPLEAFFAPHGTCVGGRRHLCRDCDRERQRERRRRIGERAHAENSASAFARRSPLGPAGVRERPTVSEVAARYGAVCVRCGVPVDLADAELDHFPTAVLDGGLHELANLRLAHRACNIRAAGSDRWRRNRETFADGSTQVRLPLDVGERA